MPSIVSLASGSASGRPRLEAVGVLHVARGHLAREVGARDAERPGGVVDLVVDVGDVRHERDVVALVLEEPLEQREDDERARVADVDPVVDGRAAGVDPDAARARAARGRLTAAGARVVQADRAHGSNVRNAHDLGKLAAATARRSR